MAKQEFNMKIIGHNNYEINPSIDTRKRLRDIDLNLNPARLRYEFFKAYCLHRSELLQGVERHRFRDIMRCDATEAGIARFN